MQGSLSAGLKHCLRKPLCTTHASALRSGRVFGNLPPLRRYSNDSSADDKGDGSAGRTQAQNGKRVGLLERLASGRPVVGDGSFVFTLEKRGYVKAGPFTPEAAVQYPEAVRQLSREFLRAGADVIQAFTFYSTDDKLQYRGSAGRSTTDAVKITSDELNRAACDIAREVADEGGALVVGGISPTPSYLEGKSKSVVQKEFEKQCQVFLEKDVDFLLAEFFGQVEEIEWGIEVMKSTGKPVAATMRICPIGDSNGVSVGECAVRMVNAGADVIGVNCLYDPSTSLATMKLMKSALEEAELNPFLMAQPVGFHTEEVNCDHHGYMSLPDYPLAMETRLISRADAHEFAREAYELGVHYIGGCCGFEPYHIRAIAEELAPERGVLPPGADKSSEWGQGLRMSAYKFMHSRSTREYWVDLKPAAGRSVAPALSKIDKR
ncbi:betaine--homocysteine S-methyltransferase 1-like [Ptychodera flava]|uniref:betaine--homocysteine S-methyltransferase 1-like n=1 Tax=Ptychodera flava TaxID=63121 RepID=UPI00396AA275